MMGVSNHRTYVMNDKFGHDFGDGYIREASQIICQIYKRSPVFRIGGDEFAVILEGADLETQEQLEQEIMEGSLKNTVKETGVVIAIGTAVRQDGEGFNDVFRRADKAMYDHKSMRKEKRPSHNLR